MLVFPAGQAWRKWVMGAVFGVSFVLALPGPVFAPSYFRLTLPPTLDRPQLITPVGIAIGMGVHASYNPNSPEALLSIGVLDSIRSVPTASLQVSLILHPTLTLPPSFFYVRSAGLLLYSGIVELCVLPCSFRSPRGLR